jgi:hypothetical protein
MPGLLDAEHVDIEPQCAAHVSDEGEEYSRARKVEYR